MSAGAFAAAVALVAHGFSNARKFEIDRERSKLAHEIRQGKVKEKYDKRLPKTEQEILEAIHDHINIPDLPKSSKSCPECCREFSLINISGLEIDCCVYCNSFWFDTGELMEFSGLESDVPSNHLKSRASKYRCPVCQQKMREVVFKIPSNLLVDQCSTHGVYLENKEIFRVIEMS